VSGQWPDGSGPAYQAAKAGISALARAAGFEEHAHGVRFSVVNPGVVNTPILQKRPVPPPPEVAAAMLRPEDVAEACHLIVALPRRAHIPELTMLPARLQALGKTSVANPEPAPE
jgi:NAD(P)-dependent dehydrogenase (short-subunit alcohol dehydrogenase family)